jgi:FAD binding domain of DNA photolyase
MATGLNVGKPYVRCVPHLEGKRFDTQGEYVKRWIPELSDVPLKYVHRPWKMDERMQEEYNCQLGLDYPHPIRDPVAGELKRRKRYLRRKGIGWSEEGKVVPREHVPNRQGIMQNERTSDVVDETVSTQDGDDWYRDMNVLNKESDSKGGKWNVSLDDALDDEWSNDSTDTATTKDNY